MFFIAYTSKGQVPVFAGWVKIMSLVLQDKCNIFVPWLDCQHTYLAVYLKTDVHSAPTMSMRGTTDYHFYANRTNFNIWMNFIMLLHMLHVICKLYIHLKKVPCNICCSWCCFHMVGTVLMEVDTCLWYFTIFVDQYANIYAALFSTFLGIISA